MQKFGKNANSGRMKTTKWHTYIGPQFQIDRASIAWKNTFRLTTFKHDGHFEIAITEMRWNVHCTHRHTRKKKKKNTIRPIGYS